MVHHRPATCNAEADDIDYLRDGYFDLGVTVYPLTDIALRIKGPGWRRGSSHLRRFAVP